MKPTVHYYDEPTFVNGRAFVIPVDHYRHGDEIHNGNLVLTSCIVSRDEATGVFETQNTIYKPLRIPKATT
jgi:hypothetical protein